MPEQPSFTCPHCGMTSFNPLDVVHGYCGRCHAFTRGNAVEVVDYLDIMPAIGARRDWPRVKEEMEQLKLISEQSGVRILPWKGHNIYREVYGKEAPPDKAFTLNEIVELCRLYLKRKQEVKD